MARSTSSEMECLDRPSAIHRRAASLAIARSGDGDGPGIVGGTDRADRRALLSRRISLSAWRAPSSGKLRDVVGSEKRDLPESEGGKKKGAIWSWKPVRALSHLGKRRTGCLFSVEVHAIHGLPASMDGLRLAVTVRKAETRDGAVQTLPSRVHDGAADFDETVFIKCNLYFTGGEGTGKPLKLDPRRFVVSVVSVEAPELCFGAGTVDVSSLVLDSVEKSSEGGRVRRFDKTFNLSGKASGGELVVKLGFHLMEDAGLSLYNQAEGKDASPPRARLHTKNSFSVATPKVTASDSGISPSMRAYKQLVESLRIDEHGDPLRSPIPRKPDDGELSQAAAAATDDDLGFPEYEVIDKGVETVKEVVHYRAHRDVLQELDSIAEQIEAIEALMTSGGRKAPPVAGSRQQQLDAEEETVTKEFLQMLETEGDDRERKLKQPLTPRSRAETKAAVVAAVPDLARGVGPAVQTRGGGFLMSMNPFNVPFPSRDGPPKLAMQMSRPFVLPGATAASAFEVLQKIAAVGPADEVRAKVSSFGEMDDLTGKTPEQMAFEGIAAAVITGRRAEGASSSAARSVRLVRKLAAALSKGRSERLATGIWKVGDDPETVEEVLAFALQRVEALAVDGLMIQADMADEDAPFDVSPAATGTNVFHSLVSPEEWAESRGRPGRVTLLVAVQLRDPSRGYEVVGAPMVAVVQTVWLPGGYGDSDDAGKFKVTDMHVGGAQARSAGGDGGASSWRVERQKLTAMQWLLAHGHARAGKGMSPRRPRPRPRRWEEVVWSVSTRVLAGMWLKTTRNPDVKIGSSVVG